MTGSSGEPACRRSTTFRNAVDLVSSRRARRRRSRPSSNAPPARGDRSAVIFGSAHDLGAPAGPSLRERARGHRPGEPGWPCAAAAAWASSISSTGSGRSATSSPIHCPSGPVAFVSHSGSAFSALAQDPPAARLHARRLVRPGARHAGRLVPRLRARPPRDWHRGAAPRGPPGARGVAVGARPRGRGAGSRSWRSPSAARRPGAPWWPPTRAPSPATTGPGRHCSTPTGSSESGISTR